MEQQPMPPVDTPAVTPAEPWWRRRPGLIWLLVGVACGAVGDAAGLAWWQTSLTLVVGILAYEVWSWRRVVARRRRSRADGRPPSSPA